MKWIAIAGGWRKTNNKIDRIVRAEVCKILSSGNGIVSGGALGVDCIATDEALNMGCNETNIKIFIPSSLSVYRGHYFKRAEEGVVTHKQVELLITQLEKIKAMDALIEGTETILNKETYFKRITEIINNADELIAFHINQTEGTQDTIDKANKKGMPVKVFTFTLD